MPRPRLREEDLPKRVCLICGAKIPVQIDHKGSIRTNLYMMQKYCSQSCRNAGKIKPDAVASPSTTRIRTRHTMKALCEVCGAVAVLIHHIDSNPRNTVLGNLQSLCHSCHNYIHGASRHHQVCRVCGSRVESHGHCTKHWRRIQKYGSPYVYGDRYGHLYEEFPLVQEGK